MSDLIERIRTQLFGNLAHYRQRCINELSDAEQVAKFMAKERGQPVAWRYRYVYRTGASPWRIRQTPVKAYAPTDSLAACEVQALYL